MNLLHLVDRLEELVASAQKMPIGSRAIVDRRRLLDLVDQMRIAIPQEVREAQEMVAQRDARRREAEEEARLLVARAEERAARLVEQHELSVAARRRAEEIARQTELRLEERIDQANADIEERIAKSRRLAEQQMEAADEYARELLARLERQLQAFTRSVQSGLSQLERGNPFEAIGRELERERGAPIQLRRNQQPTPEHEPPPPEQAQQPQASEQPQADPGVIDDFAMTPLDDEPVDAEGRDTSLSRGNERR